VRIPQTSAGTLLESDLALIDTKWVLGHWYLAVMPNGRSVADMNLLAAMVQEELGHVRALWRIFEEMADIPEGLLEHGRSSVECASMELLDRPPGGWPDFVVTAFFAEGAVATEISRRVQEAVLPGLTATWSQVAQDEEFHHLALSGWLKALAGEDRDAARAAVQVRLPLALLWFGPGGGRSWSAYAARAQSVLGPLGLLDNDLLRGAEQQAWLLSEQGAWDPVRRRSVHRPLPRALWELLVPTSVEAVRARRPRRVNVDDHLLTTGSPDGQDRVVFE